tara:strand:- start:1058 stop:1225 length:168 start_codon:yes stop_codon:yes gene_type:complete
MDKVRVRFPNHSEYDNLYIDWSEWREEKVFSDEVFGYYCGNYIAILKEDYDKRRN